MCSLENWEERWQQKDTPWVGDRVNDSFYSAYPRLLQLLQLPPDQISAFVPLAGNSPAVRFLYDKGHAVTAVEYVAEALNSLRTEQFSGIDLKIQDLQSPAAKKIGKAYSAGRLSLREQDIFDFPANKQFDLIYDRGALVAFPPEDQPRYARRISDSLSPRGVIFVRCSEFADASAYNGPPFSVGTERIKLLFPDLVIVEESSETIQTTQPRHLDAGIKSIALIDLTLVRGS